MFRSCLLLLALSSLVPSSWSQLVATPANIVCYQEVVASQGSYAQIDASLKSWSQKLYNTLNLTGPIELSVGWARVPDRTGFENNCTGPYPNIADLFVHIQTNGGSNFDSVSSALESFIAANPLTSQPNIVCSARSIVTFLPGCGKTGAAGLNNATLVPPTNATGNATTSAPTNATSPSNATIAPTTTPTLAPSNATTAPTTAAPSNATISPTTAAPSNATISPTTAAPSNATSAPTNATSNSTIAPTTAAPSNGTVLPTLVPTIRPNATTGGNLTNSTTAPTTTPVASNDLQATGTVSANGAQPIMTGIGMSISIIVSIISIML